MLTVALQTLKARWVSFVGTFLALALGVTMITAICLLLVSAFQLPERGPQRFASAPAVVFATDRDWDPAKHDLHELPLQEAKGVSANLLAKVEATGDVVVDRSFYAQVAGGPSDSVGHPWPVAEFGGYTLASGREPRADNEIVTSGPAGGQVTVYTADGPQQYTVVGKTSAVDFENAVFFTESEAARLSPRISALVAKGPLESVNQAVGTEALVLTGNDRHLADPSRANDLEDIDNTVTLLPIMAAVAGSTAIFVVASTFAFSVIQRRREIALLLVVGATPKQVRRMLLAEAAIVGTIASALGCVLGMLGANLLAGWLFGLGITPPWFGTQSFGLLGWLTLIGAFVIGLSVSLLGVGAASWRAGRVRPVEALREADVDESANERGRLLLGATGLAAGVGLAAYVGFGSPAVTLAPNSYVPLLLVPVMAFALLAPAAVGPVTRLLTWPLARSRGAGPMWVRQSALSARRRTAATAAPVLLTVGIASSLLAATSSINNARDSSVRNQTDAQYILVPDGTPGLSREVVERARSVNGIEVMAPIITTIYTRDGDQVDNNDAQVVDTAALASTLNLTVFEGSLRDLRDDTIVVPGVWGYEYGQTIEVSMADGTVAPLKVAAVYKALRGQDVAYLSPRFADSGKYARDGLARRAFVHVLPGADPAAVETELRAATRDLGVNVMTTGQLQVTEQAANRQLTAVRQQSVAVIVILFCFIAILNTLLMATSERRRDIAILRMAGATPRQVLKVFAGESLLVGAVGVVLAAGASAVNLAGLWFAMNSLFGSSPIELPWLPIIAVTVFSMVLAVVGAVVPAISALRRPASELAAIRE